MQMDVSPLKIAEKIVTLKREIDAQRKEELKLDREKYVMLEDCRHHFLNLIASATKKTAPKLVEDLQRCGILCKNYGDQFHTGFFFTLVRLLQVKHGIVALPEREISKTDFEERWIKTRTKLRL